jgi:hypothetical protein
VSSSSFPSQFFVFYIAQTHTDSRRRLKGSRKNTTMQENKNARLQESNNEKRKKNCKIRQKNKNLKLAKIAKLLKNYNVGKLQNCNNFKTFKKIK